MEVKRVEALSLMGRARMAWNLPRAKGRAHDHRSKGAWSLSGISAANSPMTVSLADPDGFVRAVS